MKKIVQITIAILITTAVVFPVNSKPNVPEKVRIGLYSDSSAATSVTVSSETGLKLGYTDGGRFITLMEYTGTDTLTVSKDVYFIKTGALTVEYSPSDMNLPAGERYGPYHIQIGAACSDFNSANQRLMQYRQKGISAYPAYTDRWYIWYGQFTDASLAQKEISDVLRQKLGQEVCKVLPASKDNIKVLNADGSVRLICGVPGKGLTVCPSAKTGSPYLITINGKQFRGDVEFKRLEGSDMTVVNVLPLEHYLYGVVPREIGAGSPLEALKAQAVCARTYTVMNMGKHGSGGFDLCSAVHCQAYSGYEWERPNSCLAVDQTIGELLTYNGKLASTFYYSSSGGVTEDVRYVWGSTNYPYLVSVEDKYETPDTLNYTWEIMYTAAKIKDYLKNWRKGTVDIGEIRGIKVTETAPSGRVTALTVYGTKGEKEFFIESARLVFSLNSQMYTVSTDSDIWLKTKAEGETAKAQPLGLKVKSASGVKVIRDNPNSIKVKGASGTVRSINVIPSQYKFTGRGWGHAVGMSQNGAKGMANAGFKYDQILQHYFPGTKVE